MNRWLMLTIGLLTGALAGFSTAQVAAGYFDLGNFMSQFMPQLLATIAGVIGGALLTFKVEHARADKQENERRAAAINLAIHTLGQMRCDVADFVEQVVDPVRKSPIAWYCMPPSDMRVLEVPRFQYADLQFLFRSSDKTIMSKLALEESRFAKLVLIIQRRNELHMQEVQPTLESHGLVSKATVADIERSLGPRRTKLLQDYTTAIVEFADKSLVSIHTAALQLHAAGATLCGDEVLVSLTEELFKEERAADPANVPALSAM